MKKALLSALIFFACLLSACGGEHSVSGRIVEADTDPGAGLVSFVVRTDRDKEVGILLTDETHIFTFVDGLDADTFRDGAQTDVTVTVTYAPSRRSLVTEDGNKVTAYNATHIEVEACRLPDTARLSDGTELEVWQSSRYLTYFLPDGTELLRVNTPVGPSADYMVGQESLVFFPEYVTVCFPQGSLPSQEYTFLVTVNYADGASALLQDWALPAAPAEEPA